MSRCFTKRPVILWLVCVISGQFLSAQEFNTGLILDDEAFRQEVESTPEYANDGQKAGEAGGKISLRDYSPFPENQGDTYSGIGWAMGYGALTISHAIREGNTDRKTITKNAFSALYLYNQSKIGSNCKSNASIPGTAKILKEKGDCSNDEFDSPKTNCERKPDETLVTASQKFAIKDYVALFDNTTPNGKKARQTKISLSEGKPVIVGMKVKESLRNLTNENPVWKPGGDEDRSIGAQALVVVGYDDGPGNFELMNSWGPNWGDGGFFFMSYKDFAENAMQGLQIILPEESLTPETKARLQVQREDASNAKNDAIAKQQDAERQKQLAAEELKKAETAQAEQKIREAQDLLARAEQLEKSAMEQKVKAEATIANTEDRMVALKGDFFVKLVEMDEYGALVKDEAGQQKFRELQPAWNGKFYTLDKTDWDEGDQFQVIARNIKKDRYVYLFSFDGNNKLEVHWPRTLKAEMEEKPVSGPLESALVARVGAEIIIPNKDRYLTRENLLDDNICVLYSFDKIEDIKERLNSLRGLSGSFEEQIDKAFGDLIIPSDLIKYGQQQMSCETNVIGRGSVIPIIVKIQNE